MISIDSDSNETDVDFFDSYVFGIHSYLLSRKIMVADYLEGHTRIPQQMSIVLYLEVIVSLLKELADPLINFLSVQMNSCIVPFYNILLFYVH